MNVKLANKERARINMPSVGVHGQASGVKYGFKVVSLLMMSYGDNIINKFCKRYPLQA